MSFGFGFGLEMPRDRFVGGDTTSPNKMIIESFELTTDTTSPNKMIINSFQLT
jgi:hypothetical protein